MSESIVEAGMIKEEVEDHCSVCSDRSRSKDSAPQRITVEYEQVGSFEVFETICPLEFHGAPRKSKIASSQEPPHYSGAAQLLKANKSKIKTISIASDLASESNEDLTAYYNPRLYNMSSFERSSQPPSISITLDAFFRSENPTCKEPIEGEAAVYWARGDFATSNNNNSSSSSSNNNNGQQRHSQPQQSRVNEPESDLDPDIELYILSQQEKKRKGMNVTGENLWYDQERSIIRNLHTDGSISLTSYGDTDKKIFGKTEIFDAIMTCEERAMLRARNTDTAYTKVEKKKKTETRKGKKIRPKDQGDWL